MIFNCADCGQMVHIRPQDGEAPSQTAGLMCFACWKKRQPLPANEDSSEHKGTHTEGASDNE